MLSPRSNKRESNTIYALMARGLFPRPMKLTAKAVGWPESVLAEWLASRRRAQVNDDILPVRLT
jgi:predicted DNA-binding transcriptional regulator AlpA